MHRRVFAASLNRVVEASCPAQEVGYLHLASCMCCSLLLSQCTLALCDHHLTVCLKSAVGNTQPERPEGRVGAPTNCGRGNELVTSSIPSC